MTGRTSADPTCAISPKQPQGGAGLAGGSDRRHPRHQASGAPTRPTHRLEAANAEGTALKEPRPLPCRTWQGTTAKLLSQWSCPSPALRGAHTMSGYGWTTRIRSNGGFGFSGVSGCVGLRHLETIHSLSAGGRAEAGMLIARVTKPSKAALMAIRQRRRSGSGSHQAWFTP